MKRSFDIYSSTAISAVLGFIFILAGISKLVDMTLFQHNVDKLHYLPAWSRAIAVFWLPGLELMVGLCLLCRIAVREASLIALFLMVIFLWLSIHATLIDSKAECGCFKIVVPAIFKLSGWWVVGRDFLFVLGCQYLAMHGYKNLPKKAGVEIGQNKSV